MQGDKDKIISLVIIFLLIPIISFAQIGGGYISNGVTAATIPGTPVNSVQFNNPLGTFAGSANFIWDNTNQVLTVASSSTNTLRGIVSAEYDTGTNSARISGYKARGTLSSPSTIVTGDFLSRWSGFGYDSANFIESASIAMGSVGTIAATRVPSFMSFLTSTDATPSVMTEAMRILSNQFVGIKTTTPVTELQVSSSQTTSPRGIMSAQYSSDTNGARFHMRKARGTEAVPVIIVSGDNIGRKVGSGYDGSNYLEMVGMIYGTEGTIAVTRIPTNIQFLTATDAAPSVLTEVLRLNSAQNVGIGTGATITAAVHITRNGALSTGNGPAMKLDGTWITGGSATTTKPYFLIEPAGTTTTAWSTNGTGLGINAATGFTGALIEAQVGGATRLTMTGAGNLSVNAGLFIGTSINQTTGNLLTIANLNQNNTNFFPVAMSVATYSQTSGNNGAVRISPIYNQLSGTAANTDLLINRTNTAVGSGAQLYQDWQLATVSQAKMAVGGDLTVRSHGSAGTVPGISGCAADTQTGGATSGTFTSRTTGACTVVLTFAFTSPTGWFCSVGNRITTANLMVQSASSTTSCTVTGTTVTGDVIGYAATFY